MCVATLSIGQHRRALCLLHICLSRAIVPPSASHRVRRLRGYILNVMCNKRLLASCRGRYRAFPLSASFRASKVASQIHDHRAIELLLISLQFRNSYRAYMPTSRQQCGQPGQAVRSSAIVRIRSLGAQQRENGKRGFKYARSEVAPRDHAAVACQACMHVLYAVCVGYHRRFGKAGP